MVWFPPEFCKTPKLQQKVILSEYGMGESSGPAWVPEEGPDPSLAQRLSGTAALTTSTACGCSTARITEIITEPALPWNTSGSLVGRAGSNPPW